MSYVSSVDTLRRRGYPRTNAQRTARHKRLYNTDIIPPRGSGLSGNFWGDLGKKVGGVVKKIAGPALKTGLSFIPGGGVISTLGPTLLSVGSKYAGGLIRKGVSKKGARKLTTYKMTNLMSTMRVQIAQGVAKKKRQKMIAGFAVANKHDKSPNISTIKGRPEWLIWLRAPSKWRKKGVPKATIAKESARRQKIYRTRRTQEIAARKVASKEALRVKRIEAREARKQAILDREARAVAREEVKRPEVQERGAVHEEQATITRATTDTPPGYRPVLVPKGAAVRIVARPAPDTVAREYQTRGVYPLRAHKPIR